jgi:exoribonuclease R
MKERVELAKRLAAQKRPLGIVVAILEDNHTVLHSGYISPSTGDSFSTCQGDECFMFRPIDKRVPWGLVRGRVETVFRDALQSLGRKISEALFLAEYQPWETHHRRPTAHVLKQLGTTGDVEAETQAILLEYGVNEKEFGPEVEACLPKIPWHIPAEELQSRRDFRSARIFTCDPLTARDLDDALSCWPLPDGTFEVGVHIADVSYFVRPNTTLDTEAQRRSTSVYLV